MMIFYTWQAINSVPCKMKNRIQSHTNLGLWYLYMKKRQLDLPRRIEGFAHSTLFTSEIIRKVKSLFFIVRSLSASALMLLQSTTQKENSKALYHLKTKCDFFVSAYDTTPWSFFLLCSWQFDTGCGLKIWVKESKKTKTLRINYIWTFNINQSFY